MEPLKTSNKELVGASSALLILGVLRRGESYGYDIVRQINEAAGGIFTWQEGTIYPLLHKLERGRQIQSRWEKGEGKARKYYSLTPAGRAALRQGAEQWSMFNEVVHRLAGARYA